MQIFEFPRSEYQQALDLAQFFREGGSPMLDTFSFLNDLGFDSVVALKATEEAFGGNFLL